MLTTCPIEDWIDMDNNMPDTNTLWQQLSGRCFISHAYADSESVENLVEMLPAEAEPVIFERVRPDPLNAVSDGIVSTIMDCDFLVYLERGESARSFWVAFERDFALRSGRGVFAFDPGTGSLRKDESEPLSLNVSAFYHENDAEAVEALFDWMRTNRHFDLTQTVSHVKLGSMSGDTAIMLEEQLLDGGVVLYLCGSSSAGTIDHVRDPGFRDYLLRTGDFQARFLLERLDGSLESLDPYSPFQYKDEVFYDEADPYDYLFGVFARVDPGLSLKWQPAGGRVIDLLGGAENMRFNLNRVDDLIVRLYEALLGYQKACEISPPAVHAILDTDLAFLPVVWADKSGGERLRIGTQKAQRPTWTFLLSEAQDLMVKAINELSRAMGANPTRVDSRVDLDLPFDYGFPAHYAYMWNWYPHFIELSMDIDGPRAYVYVRRVPIPGPLKNRAKAVFEKRMAGYFPGENKPGI